MKRFYILALVIYCTFFSNSCKKNSNTTDIPGLPPATQSGANTFGCLVNGVAWVTQGYGGFNNLSIDYDPGFNNGILGIAAYNFSTIPSTQIVVAIRDSLNFMKYPKRLELTKTSLYGCLYTRSCTIFSHDNDTKIVDGYLEIQKLDKVAGFVSGKFEFSLEKKDCDTIKITNGRFDIKF
jgi:hypothetical protein